MKKTLYVIVVVLITTLANAQNVGIGTSTPQAKLEISSIGNGAKILRLNTERAWVFEQGGAGATSELILRSEVNQKWFRIENSANGERSLSVLTETTPASRRVLLVEEGGRVGVGLNNPREMFEVNENAYVNGATVTQGFSVMEIAIAENTNLGGPDNAYHTIICPDGYAMINLAIYSSARLDGGERCNCIKMSDLLTNNHTWRGRGGGATSSGSATNTFPTGADNQDHNCSCNEGEIATGFEAYSNSHLDGNMKIRCTQLKSGYSLANNATQLNNGFNVRGVMAAMNIPWNTDRDNQYHTSECPPGTFVTAIAIRANTFLDGEMRCYCSGIKR